MKSFVRLFSSLWIVGGTLTVANENSAEQLFVRRIIPLFAEKCLACHGQDEDKIKGDLDMRTLAAVLKGGDSDQPALVPGQPEQSPLYLAATRTHDDWEAMPPKEADRLYDEQIGWLRDWIAGGAPWPDEARARTIAQANEAQWSAEDGVVMKTAGALSPEWASRRYKPEGLWGYQSVKKPEIRSPKSDHPVDALLALHLPDGLETAPDTDARRFIRRATFDLTGLPPTPEEVEAFVAAYDGSDQTQRTNLIRRLVDKLLDSPHYGERMAQHWLDVTRYADSSGFANDYERGSAWRYRDYVVRAFNSDKPYDQFVREQIAGDEIRPDDPEGLVATGFLRMGPWELTSMEVAKIARQRFLDDVTNSVGETFMAHSLQCARCHDHKFDPVPTHDYYAIQAVFATTQLTERPAPFLPAENTAGFSEKKYLEQRRAEHLATLQALDEKSLAAVPAWFAEKKLDAEKWDAALREARGTGPGRRGGYFVATRNLLLKQGLHEDQFPPRMLGLTPEEIGMERIANKGQERLQWELDRYQPVALAVYNGRTPQVTTVKAPFRIPANPMKDGELEQTCILTGGDPFAAGEKVKPGVLSVLTSGEQPPLPESVEGRRKAFADWVASAQNPLTTRAIVNRVWMWHFGQPIAGNPNNFGSTGKAPTHPELLDWLAAAFVEQDWSFKALHRTLMTSAAYRRSTQHPDPKQLVEKDPTGSSYAVFKPRRLSAEELRDAMLAASGELNPSLGGIPNRPEINLEAALQPRQVMGTFADAWTPNPLPEQRHRRSLYALKLRGLTDPQMEVFNAPSPDFSCEGREASTVTPQVFSLFNGQTTHSRALALAHRLAKETATDAQAIDRLFALVFSRTPTALERETCL